MKTLGERDYAAPEIMHHLLYLKLHSSSFHVIPISLNGSHRVKTSMLEEGQACSQNSLLDVYTDRTNYDKSADISNLNFVQFVTKYKVANKNLTNQADNITPRIFPVYSSNPKGATFPLYCKYQILRYKPWTLSQDNAWDDVFVQKWQDVLDTTYAQRNVLTGLTNFRKLSKTNKILLMKTLLIVRMPQTFKGNA